MSTTVASMNGTIWVFAAILIAWVLVQSFLFVRHALRMNTTYSLVTKAEMNTAIRTGAIAAIGPSINSIVVALSLIAMVGSATAFMRCGVIGAPVWELYMANVAASTAGVSFGTPEFTKPIFVLCLFCMTLASAPYFINTIVMLKPLDMAVEKSKKSGKKVSFIPYMSTAAMMGIMGYSILDYFATAGGASAAIASAIASYIVTLAARKINNPTLGSFNLAAGMVVGMAVGQIVTMVLG